MWLDGWGDILLTVVVMLIIKNIPDCSPIVKLNQEHFRLFPNSWIRSLRFNFKFVIM